MNKVPFLSRIDDTVQKHVDSVAHALMRWLGINTHWIHFGVLVVMIAVDLFRCACLAIRHDTLDLAINFGCAIWLMIVGQRLASRIPAVPPKDLFDILPKELKTVYPLVKLLGFFLLAMNVQFLVMTARLPSAVRKPFELPMDVGALIGGIAVLFGIYLLRTPNVPPPEKKTKEVLVPQQSEA